MKNYIPIILTFFIYLSAKASAPSNNINQAAKLLEYSIKNNDTISYKKLYGLSEPIGTKLVQALEDASHFFNKYKLNLIGVDTTNFYASYSLPDFKSTEVIYKGERGNLYSSSLLFNTKYKLFFPETTILTGITDSCSIFTETNFTPAGINPTFFDYKTDSLNDFFLYGKLHFINETGDDIEKLKCRVAIYENQNSTQPYFSKTYEIDEKIFKGDTHTLDITDLYFFKPGIKLKKESVLLGMHIISVSPKPTNYYCQIERAYRKLYSK